VCAWISRRDTNGLRDLWGAFLKEWQLHEKEARTGDEARADEQAAEDAAIAQARILHPEMFEVLEPEEFDEAEWRRKFVEAK
jgi:hypothetical protein